MSDITTSKNKYIEAWNSHVNSLGRLMLTPSRELSERVSKAIAEMQELVRAVADDKWNARSVKCQK
jgi:hypothetical protein